MATVPKLGLAKIGITPNVANQLKTVSRSAGGSAPRSAPRPKPASNRCETTPPAPQSLGRFVLLLGPKALFVANMCRFTRPPPLKTRHRGHAGPRIALEGSKDDERSS